MKAFKASELLNDFNNSDPLIAVKSVRHSQHERPAKAVASSDSL